MSLLVQFMQNPEFFFEIDLCSAIVDFCWQESYPTFSLVFNVLRPTFLVFVHLQEDENTPDSEQVGSFHPVGRKATIRAACILALFFKFFLALMVDTMFFSQQLIGSSRIRILSQGFINHEWLGTLPMVLKAMRLAFRRNLGLSELFHVSEKSSSYISKFL